MELRIEGSPRLRFSREAVRLLEQYSWPGNIRELENAVMHAAALCDQSVRPEDLPEDLRHSDARMAAEKTVATAGKSAILSVADWVSLAELEAEYVARVLEQTGGNQLAAVRILKVDRKTLDRMLAKHKINFKSTQQASYNREPRS